MFASDVEVPYESVARCQRRWMSFFSGGAARRSELQRVTYVLDTRFLDEDNHLLIKKKSNRDQKHIN